MPRSATTISASLQKVPPFPPVAAKLLSLLANPAVDTNEVADLIGGDATFTARLLQRVNSAEFGFVSDITNARRAVALLGIDATRQIMLAHATASYAQGGLRTEGLRRSWQHSVATAVLAEEIAAACGEFASVAFTAGIMHDIGRLGLLVAYPAEYERAIRNAAERCLDVLDFEEEEFGVHHAEAGRMLAERWGLPAEMGLIAGRHHDPCDGMELDLLRIVHVACRLADVLGYDIVKPLNPPAPADVIAQLPERARERLRRDPKELCERIERRIREFGSEPADAPPEETLALLASAGAVPLEPVPDEDPTVAQAGEAVHLFEEHAQNGARREAVSDPLGGARRTLCALDSPSQHRTEGRNRAMLLWIVAGLAAAAAAAVWAWR